MVVSKKILPHPSIASTFFVSILQFSCTISFKQLFLWPYPAFFFCTSLGDGLVKWQWEGISELLGAEGGERIRKEEGRRPIFPLLFTAGPLQNPHLALRHQGDFAV